jgi:hypothetical protein
MESGFAILSSAAAPVPKQETRKAKPAAPRALISLPTTRAEHCMDDARLATRLPYTSALIARADGKRPAGADALEMLAAHFSAARA